MTGNESHGHRHADRDVVKGKSPGVVGFRDLGLTVLDLWPGVSLPVLGWAIA